MSFKEKVKALNNPVIDSLLLARRFLFDKAFAASIKSYDDKFSVMEFEELGDLNKDKNVYIIKVDNPTYGFFACWKEGLLGLAFAERYGLTPVIDWSDKNPYYEEKGINGVFNPFEYFYEPVSDVSVEDAYKSYNAVFYGKRTRGCHFYTLHYDDQVDYDFYANIAKKHYKIKPQIKEKLDLEIKNLIGDKKTLAVQIRGVEWGNVQGHPIPPSLDIYVKKIDEAIEKCGFEQIFLATDADETVEFISNKYPGRVVAYSDVARAPKGSKTLAIFDTSIKRENNNYLLGYEVLRDMLTLTACQGFIASYSNISLAVKITKLALDEKFEFSEIIGAKICKNGVSALTLVKK